MRGPGQSPFAPSIPRALLGLGIFLVVSCWFSPTRVSAQSVGLATAESGNLVLSRLPNVLDHISIASKLTSGLTTTFSFRVTYQRKVVLGGADISVRYDLWEDVFLLTIHDGLGNISTSKQSTEQLDAWWSNMRVTLAPRSRLETSLSNPGRALDLDVGLTVLPFSSGELADTRRWLSRTGVSGRRRPPEPGDSTRTSSHLFDLLLGTSLERQALFSKKWTVSIAIPPKEIRR